MKIQFALSALLAELAAHVPDEHAHQVRPAVLAFPLAPHLAHQHFEGQHPSDVEGQHAQDRVLGRREVHRAARGRDLTARVVVPCGPGARLRAPRELLLPPATVTLGRGGARSVRDRRSAVEGARYGVDLMRHGALQEDRSLSRSTRTWFNWLSLLPGPYTIRACSLNEDDVCGAWRAVSNEVKID